jgi:hypothetical protein
MLKQYLEWLNHEDEELEAVGGFAIDSFPTKASKKPLTVIYPESVDLDNVNSKRIMIDFDGTIHKYSKGWKDGTVYDEPISGAKQFIDQLKDDGFEVVVFTSRLSVSSLGQEVVNEQKEMIEMWLKKYGIEVDGVTAEKLPAVAYVDDRAVEFNGWNHELISKIKSRVDG